MSASESSSISDDSEYSSDDSEYDCTPNYDVEDENELSSNGESDSELGIVPYAFEPVADEQWIKEYKKKQALKEELNQQLQKRIDGTIPLENWCKCGNCRVELLQDAFEAKCCVEVDGCNEALLSEDVLADVKAPPVCITLHPGFRPCCLEKWSLKQSAAKYKTHNKRIYKQLGSESHTFLRGVAFREFSQLAYDFLGCEKVRVPSCAYHAIRKTFSDISQGERNDLLNT